MERDHSSVSPISDLAALARLLEAHRLKLHAMLERRLDPALAARLDAEDILSEAFLRARRKWADFQRRPALTPYAWLYRITLDCLFEAWRRETRARRSPDRELPWPERSSVQLGLDLIDAGTTPARAAVRNELQERMRQALALLGRRDQEILWMRHYDQLTFAEAAAVLGIDESAANVRYVRALRRLRALWQQLYPETGD